MNRAATLAAHAVVVHEARAAAAEANHRLAALAGTLAQRQQTFIHRVFLFELWTGVDFGFTREEFGCVEPFLSITVPRPGPSQ